MRRKWKILVPVGILAISLFIFIGGESVQLLWNWLLPPIFGWPRITFWQALGLLALCRILFGGFGGHRGPKSNIRRRVAERMDAMDPEERERFRQRLRERCGFGPSPTPGEGQ